MASNELNLPRPFERIFPHFSYRWRYDDGQYSPYAPFTETVFSPCPPDNVALFEEGSNTAMVNSVTGIALTAIPRGGPDVVAIDILYTESISSTIYIIETIEVLEESRGSGFERLFITRRSINAAVSADQLLRNFDDVPRSAQAQEITTNRLIYGNYLQGYEQPSSVDMDLSLAPQILPLDGNSVKTSRDYTVGVVYIDQFGRQGGLLSATRTSISTEFTYINRIKLAAEITSAAPEWATHYRYFVKDSSGQHFNLATSAIYNDGDASQIISPNVWIEFNSSDRNKLQEGDVIIPRRTNSSVTQVSSNHLIQEIENEIPDDVRNQLYSVDANTTSFFTDDFASENADYYRMTTGKTVHTDSSTIPLTMGDTSIFVHDRRSTFDTRSLVTAINSFLNDIGYEGALFTDGVATGATRAQLTEQGIETINTTNAPNSDNVKLYVRFASSRSGGGFTFWNEVTGLLFNADGVEAYRSILTFNLGVQTDFETVTSAEGVTSVTVTELSDSGISANYQGFGTVSSGGFLGVGSRQRRFGAKLELGILRTDLTEEATERIQGGFWVKTARNELASIQTEFDDSGEIVALNQTWFETDPPEDSESQLDISWESSDSFKIADHGKVNTIGWSNCIATVDSTLPSAGIYIESTRILDGFNTPELVKGIRVNTPQERYGEFLHSAGLIWSGIYNSRTGVNRLNQFISALGITKELEPNYGSIQKLHTRDTNLIVLCEDKIFKVLADKDQLTNVDGSTGNITAANVVLGQTTPFIGEFGISKNPESFASYGHNLWFTDQSRGSLMQLTPGNGQLFELSNRGMSDFFRDRLGAGGEDFQVIGSFNDYTNSYIISMQGYDPENEMIGLNGIDGDIGEQTVAYDLDVERFPSRYSFIPEGGLSLGNRYYTWKDGQLWVHNSTTVPRNNFYGVQSEITFDTIINAETPSVVKNFTALGYEGSEGWEVTELSTDIESSDVLQFIEKESKFSGAIAGSEDIYGIIGVEGGVVLEEGDVVNNGFVMRPTGETRQTSGLKGILASVKFRHTSEEEQELHAINTSYFDSSI